MKKVLFILMLIVLSYGIAESHPYDDYFNYSQSFNLNDLDELYGENIQGKTIGIQLLSDNLYANTYLCAENNGNDDTKANRQEIGAWERFVLYKNGDGTISLLACNNKFLKGENGGNSTLNTQGASIGEWEKFYLERWRDTYDDVFVLKMKYNNKYVKCYQGSSNEDRYLLANGTNKEEATTFKIIWITRELNDLVFAQNDRYIGLYHEATKKFISAENGGYSDIKVNGGSLGDCETFYIDHNNDNTVSFRAPQTATYIRADNYGNNIFDCVASSIGSWEKFIIYQITDNQFTIQAPNGNYVRVVNNKLIADITSINSDTIFNIAWKDKNIYESVTAFAKNFPLKLKYHTKGVLNENWGILFHYEEYQPNDPVLSRYIWLYEAFPKSDLDTFHQGYEFVENTLEKDVTYNNNSGTYIAALNTINHAGEGSWYPSIPRTKMLQTVGLDQRILENSVSVASYQNGEYKINKNYSGYIYKPKMVNLKDERSQINMGWRWVLEITLNENENERWCIDLGPCVGAFQPRYGIIGYHSGGTNSSQDLRWLANIQDR